MYQILKSSPTKICVIYTFRKEGAKIPFIKKTEVNLPKYCSFTGDYILFQTSPKEFISLVTVIHKPSHKKIILLLASRKFSYRFIQFHNPTSFISEIKINKAYLPSIKYDRITETQTKDIKTIGLIKIINTNTIRGFYLIKQEDKKWELSIRHITIKEPFSEFKFEADKITYNSKK